MKVNRLTQQEFEKLKKQIEKIIAKHRRLHGDSPIKLKIIMPLCVGFRDCPTVEEYAGLIYDLQVALNFDNFVTFLVPKNADEEKKWRENNKEIIQYIANPPQNVEVFRKEEAWLSAEKYHNAVRDLSWSEYKESLIADGFWASYQEIFKNRYRDMYHKEAESEKDFEELFNLAKTTLADALKTNTDNHHEKHPEISKDEIRKHLEREAIDCLAVMEPYEQKKEPEVTSLILYKNSLTLYANKVRQFAWLMGHECRSVLHHLIAFAPEQVEVNISDMTRNKKDEKLEHDEAVFKEAKDMAMAFGVDLVSSNQDPKVIAQVMTNIMFGLAEKRTELAGKSGAQSVSIPIDGPALKRHSVFQPSVVQGHGKSREYSPGSSPIPVNASISASDPKASFMSGKK